MSKTYDPGFNKPPGKQQRMPEAYRIHKPYLTISKTGFSVVFHKTLVIAQDGCIYERTKDRVQPGSAIFDWSRRWTLVGHVGSEGIDKFFNDKMDEGWITTDRNYPGSLSRHTKESSTKDPSTETEKINPQSIVDLIRQRQKKQQLNFNDKIDNLIEKPAGIEKKQIEKKQRNSIIQPTPEQSLELRKARAKSRKPEWLNKLKSLQPLTKMDQAIFDLARKRREKREAYKHKSVAESAFELSGSSKMDQAIFELARKRREKRLQNKIKGA